MTIKTRIENIELRIPKPCTKGEVKRWIGILLRYAVEYPESAKMLIGYPDCIEQEDLEFFEQNSLPIVGEDLYIEYPNYEETFKRIENGN